MPIIPFLVLLAPMAALFFSVLRVPFAEMLFANRLPAQAKENVQSTPANRSRSGIGTLGVIALIIIVIIILAFFGVFGLHL